MSDLINSSPGRKRVAVLQRRLDYLLGLPDSNSYDLEEAGALKWALEKLEDMRQLETTATNLKEVQRG